VDGGFESIPYKSNMNMGRKTGNTLHNKAFVHVMVAVLILMANSFAAVVLSQLPPMSLYRQIIIDGLLFVLIAFPLLYLLVMRPFIFSREHAAEKFLESESKYQSLVESTDDSIYLVDRECRYLFINKNHTSRMGFTGEEYVGRPYADFHTPDETKKFTENVNRVITTGKSVKYEHKSMRDDIFFLQTLSPVKIGDGNTIAVTVVSKDITALKDMEERLHTLSLTDELTGLYNRRGFFNLIDHQLRIAMRQKKSLLMLYADMDNLKYINDTFGHKEGDRVLSDTAFILKETYRDSDIVARIGGDEFVVFPVGTSEDHIDTIVNRLQKNIEEYNAKSNKGYVMSISVGVSICDPEYEESVDALLSRADELMYEHKKSKQEA
jgi:diguanylate cyclase (GGDEF)-like protein/PAS domain S-box-containing protein